MWYSDVEEGSYEKYLQPFENFYYNGMYSDSGRLGVLSGGEGRGWECSVFHNYSAIFQKQFLDNLGTWSLMDPQGGNCIPQSFRNYFSVTESGKISTQKQRTC